MPGHQKGGGKFTFSHVSVKPAALKVLRIPQAQIPGRKEKTICESGEGDLYVRHMIKTSFSHINVSFKMVN